MVELVDDVIILQLIKIYQEKDIQPFLIFFFF